MKRTLYIVKTPFQCMMAIILQHQFRKGVAEIIVTDTMRNADRIVERLGKLELFQRAILYRHPSRTKELVKDVFRKKSVLALFSEETVYDELVVCMSGYTEDMTNICYDILKRRNPELKVYGYVEGYSSYTDEFTDAWKKLSIRHKVINKVAGLFFGRKFIPGFTGLYVFHEVLLHEKIQYPIIDISDFAIDNKQELKTLIFDAFGYVPERNRVSEKYVFFEECFSEDVGEQQDIKIVEAIANLVGKENVMIKRHPRNKQDRFKQLGYKTMLNQEIPWEVYALDSLQPEHVLISYSSGAAINFRFLSAGDTKTVLLYKIGTFQNFHKIEEITKQWFEKYEEIYQTQVCSPGNMDELKMLLKGQL